VFFARQEAPDPAQGGLRSLRPSMNSPVVVVEDLPAGPATAAIACLAGPAGSRVALAIRSQRSGQVVFFGPDEELRERQTPDDAFDAALTFAESLGFLFEDDRVAEAPAEARRLWEGLLEAGSRVRRAPVRELSRAVAAPAPPAEAELWLEQVAAPGPPIGRSVPLTKFRSPAAAPARGAGRAPGRSLARFRVGPDRTGS
jgi:hypothetical protein